MALTQAQVDEVTALMQQQDAARRATTTAAVALAVARTRGFNEWYSTAAITTWAASLVRGIEALQRALARQTDALFARQATVMTGRTVRPVGAVNVATLRQGITHAGAYGRVADTYRYQQSLIDSGKQVQKAIDAALNRAEEITKTDVSLVMRDQSHRFMTRQSERSAPRGQRLIGYRRIIHPELADSGTSCGMCIVASYRLYGPDELQPMHFPTCNCVPMPVYDGADPGSIINEKDLERLYTEAGGKQFEELGRTRYRIENHGELGPTLVYQGRRFRTAQDVIDAKR